MMQLKTPFEKDRTGKEWDIYPRPRFVRDSFISLNGPWELLCVGSEKTAKQKLPGKCRSEGEILVPFVPESRLSGIGKTLNAGERWIYRRSFEAPLLKDGEDLLLHFGGADQVAMVRINGWPVMKHEGGYLPFECLIRPYLKEGKNLLEVEIIDDHDEDLPLGKQSLRRGGMWYTAHSGLWQSVWMEVLPKNAFRGFRTEPFREGDRWGFVLTVTGGGKEKRTLTLKENGESVEFFGRKVTVEVKTPRLWTTEDPFLYEFSVTNGQDTVTSYTALREIKKEIRLRKDGSEISVVTLNGKPVFLHGLLDQGYYADGIVLPASPEGYRSDIRLMKEMGFNLLRKHIKVEPEIFYYECDRQGMLVMQDLVNTGHYSFIKDTALPTAGFWRGTDHKVSLRRKERFESDARELLTLLQSHPCILGITIFNEGWGQYDGSRIYKELKAAEPGLLMDTASGWFRAEQSDFVSDHIYFRPIRMKKSCKTARKQGKILMLSEYGGYALALPGHRFNEEKVYGYRQFQTKEALRQGLEHLIGVEVKDAIKEGLAAAVLTQVSDVEDETNGMLTYDRQVVKVDAARMRALAEELKRTFEEQFCD